MPSEKTSITRAEIDTRVSEVFRLKAEVEAFQKGLPLCAAWNATGTVRDALQNLAQTLHDMRTGHAQVEVVG
jgi:hypothetical protein